MSSKLISGRQAAWIFWIVVSTVGVVLAALVQWRIRMLVLGGPDFLVAHYLGYDDLARDLGYVAVVIGAIVVSGAQWLLLRQYGLAVDLWVPATLLAGIAGSVVVTPNVLRVVQDLTGSPAVPTWYVVVAAGGAAVAASGLLVGTAQWFVLRRGGRSAAIGWIPATALGGALAGSITAALSFHFLGLGPLLQIGATAAVGGLLVSVAQAPVLDRLLS